MLSSEVADYRPDEVVEITRTFEAPRALVWRLWAEPEHRLRWWGPEGFGLKELAMEFRDGGAWRMVMRHVSGYDHHVHGTFHEVREPDRLSFTYINDNDGLETLVVMDFLDLGPKTEMRFRQMPFQTEEARAAHGWGWGYTLDLLADYALKVVPANPQPVGRPRIDGVATDIKAARERFEREQVEGFKGKWNPGDPR